MEYHRYGTIRGRVRVGLGLGLRVDLLVGFQFLNPWVVLPQHTLVLWIHPEIPCEDVQGDKTDNLHGASLVHNLRH
jgi:hypothetical protein